MDIDGFTCIADLESVCPDFEALAERLSYLTTAIDNTGDDVTCAKTVHSMAGDAYLAAHSLWALHLKLRAVKTWDAIKAERKKK